MSDTSHGFVGDLLVGFAEAMAPLADAIGSPESLSVFLAEFGWFLDPDATNQNTVVAVFAGIQNALDNLTQAVTGLEAVAEGDDSALAGALAELAKAIAAIVLAVRGLVGRTGQGAWPAPLNAAGFWEEFPLELLDYLIYVYLKRYHQRLFGLFHFLGVLERDWTTPSDAGRHAYRRAVVHWDRIPTIVADPGALFPAVYGWGTSFDHRRFAVNIGFLLAGFGLPPDIGPVTDPVLLSLYYDPTATVVSDVAQVSGNIYYGISESGPATALEQVDIVLLPIPAAGDHVGPPVGFALFPLVRAQGEVAFAVTDIAKLTLSGGFEAAPIRVEIRPAGVTLAADLAGTDLSASARLDVAPPAPLVLLGDKTSSRLEFVAAHVALRAEIAGGSLTEYRVEAGFDKLSLIIDMSKSDGFLRKLLGDNPQTLDLSAALAWSSKTGFAFTGQGTLEASISVHLSIADVLHVDTIYIGLLVSGDGVSLSAAATGGLDVGPIAATVDRIGLRLDLIPVGNDKPPGNLGTLDLGFGFKPPSGLGINIDAGPVTGGGFIEFDQAAGRYAGVLALSLYSVQIKAIGLLDTRLPGGEPGYSFLILITVEFNPIQLGFGFTLNGVGGLCGINRTIVTEALQAGVRSHSLDHILFPDDPVKNAPAIISDLRAIFPPAEGRYVFGPMLKLGWGGGLNLVEAELGLILEVPPPIVIVILGQFNVNLPNPDAAVVELHLDVLGIIDFGKKLFSLDASLHDSRVAVFTIYGDMAMRLTWGDDPSFALAVGGFNPHFQPPAGFPTLKRLTIALSASDEFRLSIQSYFAITSNSFQFGAHAELYIGVSAFNVYGWLGFDALFIFQPFSFIVDFTAGLALRAGTETLLGISVAGELSGPTPWHAKGEAHVSILFFELAVSFETTWGEDHAAELPEVDPWPQLKAAILEPKNWAGALPATSPQAVVLAAPQDADGAAPPPVLLDPSGTLTFRERLLPLDQQLAKFGEAAPSPQSTFHLDQVKLGGQPVAFAVVRDKFAPGQFEQLSDADKLSRPSFEDRDAGFAVGADQVAFGRQYGLDVAFNDIYVGDDGPRPAGRKHLLGLTQQLAQTALSGAGRSALFTTGLAKYAPQAGTPRLVAMDRESFVVASVADLRQRPDVTVPVTKGEAHAALAAHIAAYPDERGTLQVVPLHELVSQ
jgi:Family of unknown function (DUF6603)